MAAALITLGIDELEVDLSVLDRLRARELVDDFVDDVTQEIQFRAQMKINSRTGNLARAIERRRIDRGDTTEGEVFVNRRRAPHGNWVEHGTGIATHTPHLIRPTSGNVMVWRAGGRLIFRTHTRGQIAQMYMRRAFDEVKASYLPGRLQELKNDLRRLA